MFDFLGLKHQSITFLADMGGHDMAGEHFFKWIIVKTEIETEVLKEEEADRKERNKLNTTNQKIKYDQLADELEKNVVKIIELWKLVTEDNTKVRNIRDQLLVVMESLKSLKMFWHREKKYLENIPTCQILYGLFLKDCVNETEEGEELINKAFEELERRKNIVLNFADIDSSSSLHDLEKAIAFVKITKKPANSFISNCTIMFAKYLGTVKKNLYGTLLSEYIPQEFVQSFLDAALSGANANQATPRDSNQEFFYKLPMLCYNGRLLKEFLVQTKVFVDQSGEQVLAINLAQEQDLGALKFIMTSSGSIRYVNSGSFV